MSDLIARLQDMVDFKHDDMDVAREAIEEIARLRAALATARREGMEQAAQIADGRPSDCGEDVAAAIRAAAKEGNP